MATALYRLGRTAYRRWPFFLLAWIIVFGALAGAAAQLSKPMQDSFTIPGIPSLQAQDTQRELFPDEQASADAPNVTVVVRAPEGQTLQDATPSAAVGQLVSDLNSGDQIDPSTPIVGPVERAQAQRRQLVEAAVAQGTPSGVAQANAGALSPLSSDGRTGTISFVFDAPDFAGVAASSREKVSAALQRARDAGLTAEVQGRGMQEWVQPGYASELLGIGVALIVLFATFFSLVAAGLPILMGVAGVAAGLVLVQIATGFTTISSSTPILASMIGLAVGIDYTLFILSRFRFELEHTDDRVEAAGLALGRAGSAVVFAGLTVVIALTALSVVGIPFLTNMGLAAAAAVAFAVLVALTLLPAVLGLLGRRIFGGVSTIGEGRHSAQDLGGRRRGRHAISTPLGVRWARMIGAAPVIAIAAVVLGLIALALPGRDLQLALPTDSTAAADTTQRKAADLTVDAFGAGRNAPLLVVIDGRRSERSPQEAQAAYGKVIQWAGEKSGVTNAQIIAVNETGDGAQALITPGSGPTDEATLELLSELRDSADIEKDAGVELGVTGVTAVQADVSDKLSSALAPYLAIIVGLAFVLLMLVFRSVLVPLTATLGFLLSVLATIGATVMVFQEELFGLVPGQPIVSFMPIILIGVVFGLAMDYQVFLVTRMREAFVHGDTPREAVVDGFRHGARVVTAAALIMISVFAAFMLQDDPLIQSMGFALAFAVLVDAFLVRMALIPALMFVMGRWAWRMPRWLDRVLPRVDVEGESLQRGPSQVDQPELVGVS